MIVTQVENTPIGDYFHDCGLTKVFEKISGIVDEFEVDTDDLNNYCDSLINMVKGLKNQIKKVETAFAKQKHQEEINQYMKLGIE